MSLVIVSKMKTVEDLMAARDYWRDRLVQAYQDDSDRGTRSWLRISNHLRKINDAIDNLNGQ